MGTYKDLGIKRIINCYDTYTLLGGHILSDEVRAARDEADTSFAWIWDLQKKAGERVAKLLHAESAFIPVGVYAGMSQCIAALMAGEDTEKMRQLPNTWGMKDEVIIQKCLRDFKYDRSITVTGAKIVDVGNETRGCTSREIEEAITDKTVAMHYMAHGLTGTYASKSCKWTSAEEMVALGNRHRIPVLIDAAFQCYPLENFTKFIAMGADGVLYSSKYFGGPNTAGILVGKKYLIDAVALHSFIGQEGASHAMDYISESQPATYASLFRGCKQDRGSIVGAVVALERYLRAMKNPERNVLAPARKRAKWFMKTLKVIPNVELTILDAKVEGVDPLKIAVKITLPQRTSEQIKGLRNALTQQDPSIWIETQANSIILNITSFRGLMMFDKADDTIVAKKLIRTIGKQE